MGLWWFRSDGSVVVPFLSAVTSLAAVVLFCLALRLYGGLGGRNWTPLAWSLCGIADRLLCFSLTFVILRFDDIIAVCSRFLWCLHRVGAGDGMFL